jgi:hypothetical protein
MQDMNRNLFGNSNLVVWQMPWTDAQLNYITSGTYMDGTNEVSILMGTNTYPTTPPVGGKTPPVYPICTSIDGGLSWTDVASSPTILFSSVVYAGNNIVWAAGPPAYPTYLSNDNGKTWTKPNGQSYLPMISAIPGYMIGVGTANDLWATTNSGVSYTMVNGSKTFIWLSVVTATEIYAINKTFQLLYSTNGASTFTQVTTLDVPVTQVQYNNGLLVVLTKAGELVYSTDNAATWQALISNTLFSIKCFTVLDGIITVVNGANQVLLTTVNMNMVVNWQLNEGYGCYGFDYSGNNNNAHIGGCMAENDEEAWEISTKIESPQFIEGANDLIPIISARISKEIAKEAAAKTRAPIVGKALLAARETAAKKAAAPKRKVTAKRAAPAAKKVIKKTKKK